MDKKVEIIKVTDVDAESVVLKACTKEKSRSNLVRWLIVLGLIFIPTLTLFRLTKEYE